MLAMVRPSSLQMLQKLDDAFESHTLFMPHSFS